MTVCTAWLGFQTPAMVTPVKAWWLDNEFQVSGFKFQENTGS